MSKVLWITAVLAFIGGLLFGYATANIAGGLLFLKSEFNLSLFQQGALVSILLLGALLGAMIGGIVADNLGRKRTLLITALLFLLSGLFLFLAGSLLALLMGRFLLGIAVGISSLLIPLYVSEMSPPNHRGAIVALSQLGITVGILLAYLAALLFSQTSNWRALFGMIMPFALVEFCLLFFLPETQAFRKFSREKKQQQPTWKILFTNPYRRILLIGVMISLFQQITGINAIIYYAPQIFRSAGFQSDRSALLATIGIGSINVLATIFSLYLIDRAGRRRLLLIGLAGMVFSLLFMVFTFISSFEITAIISMISLMIYIVSFAISLGPVTWVLISEIFPLNIRGRAMGIATFVNWFSNFVIAFSFLSLIKYLHEGGTFLLFAIIGTLGYIYVYYKVPETKNKSLEEIEMGWKKRGEL
ncbi:MAG: MFS transporter [Simkaniaceae bacterium]